MTIRSIDIGDRRAYSPTSARLFARCRVARMSSDRFDRGDVIVLIGNGPTGTGMQETAQITTALKYLPWGKNVALLTDGRFSGLSSGACVGHIGPEALQGGPIGRLRDDDVIEIIIDRDSLAGPIDLVGVAGTPLGADECVAILQERGPHPAVAPHPSLPDDTRPLAALQCASGGTWDGCVYDVDRITRALDAGLRALDAHPRAG